VRYGTRSLALVLAWPAPHSYAYAGKPGLMAIDLACRVRPRPNGTDYIAHNGNNRRCGRSGQAAHSIASRKVCAWSMRWSDCYQIPINTLLDNRKWLGTA
jgi:hypothetical protein